MIYLFFLFAYCATCFANYNLEAIYHSQSSSADANENEDERSFFQSSVSAQEAQLINSSSVDDVLLQSPSTTTARGPRSSAQSIQIRGMQADKVAIKIDGARQNFHQGHSSMLAIDMDNLKQVEIQKNSSGIDQSASLTGTINFVTKDPQDYLQSENTLGAEFSTHSNSANREQGLSAKTIYQKASTGVLLGVFHAKASNLKLNDDTTLENSAFEDISLYTKLTHKNFRFKYELFQRLDNNPLDPTLNPPGSLTELLSDNETTRNTLALDYADNLNVYVNTHSVEKTRRSDQQKETRKLQTIGVHLKQNKDFQTYGIEVYQDQLTSALNGEEIESYPKAQGSYAHLYFEQTFNYSALTLSPGVKYHAYELSSQDRPTSQGSRLSKKLDLHLALSPFVHTGLSYSEGFNAPRANQVYPSGLHSPGDDFVVRDNFFMPNPDLLHETSRNVEASVEYQNTLFHPEDLLTLKASAYNNIITDYIYLERIDRSILDDQNGSTQFINIPNVQLTGSELQLTYLIDRWEFGIDYTQIRGKNLDLDLYLEDLPADQYSYRIKYHHEEKQLTLGLLSIQLQEQNRVNPQTIQRTVSTPSALIHTIFVNKGLGKNLEANLSVHNLGNHKYRKHASHLYESAQDMRISLKYKINTI